MRNGTLDAKIDRKNAGSNSWYCVSLLISVSRQAILILIYSNGEIHSIEFNLKLTTGLINLASVEFINIPGNMGFFPIILLNTAHSIVSLSVPSDLYFLIAFSKLSTRTSSRYPNSRPFNNTGKLYIELITFNGLTPKFTKIVSRFGFAEGWVNGWQHIVMWFNNPHGPPSGVCTGQINPQTSGNNFLTVVVFIYAK